MPPSLRKAADLLFSVLQESCFFSFQSPNFFIFWLSPSIEAYGLKPLQCQVRKNPDANFLTRRKKKANENCVISLKTYKIFSNDEQNDMFCCGFILDFHF